jgi:hypothetical protein
LHPEEKKKEEPPFIILAHAVKDIMKYPFTGDGSQAPSDHLYKLETLFSNYMVYLIMMSRRIISMYL